MEATGCFAETSLLGGEFLGCGVRWGNFQCTQDREGEHPPPEATSWVLSQIRNRPCGGRLVLFIMPTVLPYTTVALVPEGVHPFRCGITGLSTALCLRRGQNPRLNFQRSVATDSQCCKRQCKTPLLASQGKCLEFPCTSEHN